MLDRRARGSNSAVMLSFALGSRLRHIGRCIGESNSIIGWVSLLLECPEASEQVKLSLPESYWVVLKCFSGCSAGVRVTLGLPGLLLSFEGSLFLALL